MFARKMKVLFLLFVMVSAFALVYLPSFSKYQELKRKETELKEEIGRLRSTLKQLVEEERLLESDSEYLEKVARENLGRVRPGEVVYKIVPAEKKKEELQSLGNEKTVLPT
ncbi:MAG TPA: septum formation initiator family protein [Candidatus Omnitrophota bacterium]|nr:septum formation initiator family protein [Candidatus Omnitrophota bacterium]